MSSDAPGTGTTTAPIVVAKVWPTSVTNGPPDLELWSTLKTDRERYDKLKMFNVPGHDDILLSDCYDRAVRLSQYFVSVDAAVGAFKHRVPKDNSQLSRVMEAFSEAVKNGLRAFWVAMNADALELLEKGKYARIHVALVLPSRKNNAGKRPLNDPEDEVPLDESEDRLLKPVIPPKDEGEEEDFVRIFVSFLNALCNHYPKLSEVGPKVGVSWSQVLGSVVQAGQAFYDEYTGEKKDPAHNTPVLQLPGPKVDVKPGGKQNLKHSGNGATPVGDSKL